MDTHSKAGDAGTWDIYLLPTCCWPWTLGFSQSWQESPPLPQRPGVWLNQAGLAGVSRDAWWGSNGYVHLSQNSVGNLIARILMMSGTTLDPQLHYTAMPTAWKRISTLSSRLRVYNGLPLSLSWAENNETHQGFTSKIMIPLLGKRARKQKRAPHAFLNHPVHSDSPPH